MSNNLSTKLTRIGESIKRIRAVTNTENVAIEEVANVVVNTISNPDSNIIINPKDLIAFGEEEPDVTRYKYWINVPEKLPIEYTLEYSSYNSLTGIKEYTTNETLNASVILNHKGFAFKEDKIIGLPSYLKGYCTTYIRYAGTNTHVYSTSTNTSVYLATVLGTTSGDYTYSFIQYGDYIYTLDKFGKFVKLNIDNIGKSGAGELLATFNFPNLKSVAGISITNSGNLIAIIQGTDSLYHAYKIRITEEGNYGTPEEFETGDLYANNNNYNGTVYKISDTIDIATALPTYNNNAQNMSVFPLIIINKDTETIKLVNSFDEDVTLASIMFIDGKPYLLGKTSVSTSNGVTTINKGIYKFDEDGSIIKIKDGFLAHQNYIYNVDFKNNTIDYKLIQSPSAYISENANPSLAYKFDEEGITWNTKVTMPLDFSPNLNIVETVDTTNKILLSYSSSNRSYYKYKFIFNEKSNKGVIDDGNAISNKQIYTIKESDGNAWNIREIIY